MINVTGFLCSCSCRMFMNIESNSCGLSCRQVDHSAEGDVQLNGHLQRSVLKLGNIGSEYWNSRASLSVCSSVLLSKLAPFITQFSYKQESQLNLKCIRPYQSKALDAYRANGVYSAVQMLLIILRRSCLYSPFVPFKRHKYYIVWLMDVHICFRWEYWFSRPQLQEMRLAFSRPQLQEMRLALSLFGEIKSWPKAFKHWQSYGALQPTEMAILFIY